MDITYASPSFSDLFSASMTSPATNTAATGNGSTTSRPVRIIPLKHPNLTRTSSSSFSSLPPQFPFSRWATKLRRMTWLEWIEFFLPCMRWIRTYKWREYLQADLMAGITVGVMLVPQSMSYAKLAGLQPIYGLYSGFVPLLVYGLFGSSRQLAVGPVALVSLLCSNVLSSIAEPSSELYTQLAILLALMVGILECIMGILRLGWLIRFISHSVISGFTTSSAIIIGLSQAKYFLGYNVVNSSKIIPLVKSIVAGADKFKWQPFLMGSIMLAILLTMKHLGKSRKQLRFLRAGGPLTAVVLGTIFVKIFHPSSISLVGDIPQGLPKFSVPKAFEYAESLIPTAALLTGVAILESVGIAKALAAKNGYELDSNQELVGLGISNVLGSFFSAYPTTGSFSRSAVNHESGAKSGISGIVSGIIVTCALLFFTPLFEYIPQCGLAAIVISAVIGLVDYDEAIFLWRVDKKDFLLWTITSITTLFFGIEVGVLVGVGVSLAFVIHESANPHIAVLGRLPGTTVYRNVEQYPEAYRYNGIVIVRIDAPIYFANTSYIKDRLREYELDVVNSTRRGPEVERIYFVILEMAPVTYIDSSAVQALKDLYQEYKLRGIQIAISNPSPEVLFTLSRSGVVDLIGKEWYFVRVHDAVQICLQRVQSLTGASNGSPGAPTFSEDKPSLFERLLKQRGENLSITDIESGIGRPPPSNSNNDKASSHLEPLLPKQQ
ncbi:putative sulfate transporter 4.2 [Stylosanthes scabra]|uniref:Sulfate transporter 4.2 n=1 Tax=Stylosanthes scabra TaxID=79078 RepID=A0ABU6T8K7_9FABA|nr:putative sulfate transporter 4.2 [Stylosanthes scabra]